MKSILPIISLLLTLLSTLLNNGIAVAQNESLLSRLSAISESDIQTSAIAFVNTTSSPGLEGATLNVYDAQRSSDQ